MKIAEKLGLESEEQRLNRKFTQTLDKYNGNGIGADSLGRGAVAEALNPYSRHNEDFESVIDRMGRDKAADTVNSFPGGAQREAGHVTAWAAESLNDEEFDEFLNRYGSEKTKETIESYCDFSDHRAKLGSDEDEIRNITENLGAIARTSVSWPWEEELYNEVLDTVGQFEDAEDASAVADYLSEVAMNEGKTETKYDVDILKNPEVQEDLGSYEGLDADYVRETVREARPPATEYEA